MCHSQDTKADECNSIFTFETTDTKERVPDIKTTYMKATYDGTLLRSNYTDNLQTNLQTPFYFALQNDFTTTKMSEKESSP